MALRAAAETISADLVGKFCVSLTYAEVYCCLEPT